MKPIHPRVTVQLTGRDGNAFAIIGSVSGAMRRAGCSTEEVRTFVEEATAGDYHALLRTAMKYVDVH